MYRYIGIEDLVASALIEIIKREDSNRKVSFQALADYGAVIVSLLSDSGQNAILFLTKEHTYEFIHDYANFFSIKKYNDVEYIELKKDKTVEDLRHQFRENLTVDLAKALVREESLKALNVGVYSYWTFQGTDLEYPLCLMPISS